GLARVGREDHDDVGPLRDFADIADLQARGLHLVARLARRRQTDLDGHAAVFEVQRVRMSLRSVTDDGDFLCANEREVGITVVEHLGWHSNLLTLWIVASGFSR